MVKRLIPSEDQGEINARFQDLQDHEHNAQPLYPFQE